MDTPTDTSRQVAVFAPGLLNSRCWSGGCWLRCHRRCRCRLCHKAHAQVLQHATNVRDTHSFSGGLRRPLASTDDLSGGTLDNRKAGGRQVQASLEIGRQEAKDGSPAEGAAYTTPLRVGSVHVGGAIDSPVGSGGRGGDAMSEHQRLLGGDGLSTVHDHPADATHLIARDDRLNLNLNHPFEVQHGHNAPAHRGYDHGGGRGVGGPHGVVGAVVGSVGPHGGVSHHGLVHAPLNKGGVQAHRIVLPLPSLLEDEKAKNAVLRQSLEAALLRARNAELQAEVTKLQVRESVVQSDSWCGAKATPRGTEGAVTVGGHHPEASRRIECEIDVPRWVACLQAQSHQRRQPLDGGDCNQLRGICCRLV